MQFSMTKKKRLMSEPVRLGEILPVVMRDIDRRMQQKRGRQRLSPGQLTHKLGGSVADGSDKFQIMAV